MINNTLTNTATNIPWASTVIATNTTNYLNDSGSYYTSYPYTTGTGFTTPSGTGFTIPYVFTWPYTVSASVFSPQELNTTNQVDDKSEISTKEPSLLIGSKDYLIALRDAIDAVLEGQDKGSCRYQDKDGLKKVEVKQNE